MGKEVEHAPCDCGVVLEIPKDYISMRVPFIFPCIKCGRMYVLGKQGLVRLKGRRSVLRRLWDFLK